MRRASGRARVLNRRAEELIMAHPITGFTSGIAGQGLKLPGEYQQSPGAGGRSFETVLRGGAEKAPEQATHASSDTRPRRVAPPAEEPARPEMLDARVRQELTRLVLHDEAGGRGEGIFGFISQAEKATLRSDTALRELSVNKDLTPGDLLVMQAMVYKAAQSTEVLSKVVDQVTGSVRTILNTNV